LPDASVYREDVKDWISASSEELASDSATTVDLELKLEKPSGSSFPPAAEALTD
jgi:hypothetical protein